MPHALTKTVFFFNELSEEAKEKAREWYRDGAFDYDWWDCVYEDAERVAEILGIEFTPKRVPRIDGKFNTHPTIYFSGFSSQGDGACFEGRYSYAKGCQKKIREYAPKDATLHAIADALHREQCPMFYRIQATTKHQGHYYHSGEMAYEVFTVDQYGNTHEVERDVFDSIASILRDFADWIYSSLEKEYDYLNSNEVVDETIMANEYEFTESGRRST